jgi:hypothetical protein
MTFFLLTCCLIFLALLVVRSVQFILLLVPDGLRKPVSGLSRCIPTVVTIFAGTLLLVACATQSPAPSSASASTSAPVAATPTPVATPAPAATFAQLTDADFIHSLVIAQNVDPHWTSCGTYLHANFDTLVAALSGPASGGMIQPVTAFEQGHIGLNNLLSNGTGSGIYAFNGACGAYSADLRSQGMTAAAALAALLGRIGIRVAVPALPMVP